MVLLSSKRDVITSVFSMKKPHWTVDTLDAHDSDCPAINSSVWLLLREENATIKAGAPWEAGSTVNSQPIKSNWLGFGLIVSYTACIGSSSTVIALQKAEKSDRYAVTAQDMDCRHVSQMQKWRVRLKKKKKRQHGGKMKVQKKKKNWFHTCSSFIIRERISDRL